MTIKAEPFPKPSANYSLTWAARLVQRLDFFLNQYTLGEREINGALITNERRVKKVRTVTASYQILLTDHIIFSNLSAAGTHTLPPGPSIGQEFEIRDSSGSASSNTISIAPPSGINLNGAMTPFTLSTDYGKASVIYDGTEYLIA